MSLYKHPPPQTQVICVDEMGPVSAKTYFTYRPATHRPKVAPDYGRRGKQWVFGAFEPKTGLAMTFCADRRDTKHFLLFLDQLVQTWASHDLILIMDNLAVHKTMDVLLWALAHPRVRFLFQPTYAPWLNLIEPWWKTLRSLALKGKRFTNEQHIRQAIEQATCYWNQRRKPYQWLKDYPRVVA